MASLKSKTKLELEEIGREYGVELDRRKSKAALVAEVEELLSHVDDCECGQTSDEFGKCDGSHACEEVINPLGPKGYSWVDGYLAEDGIIISSTSRGLLKGLSNKKGGKVVQDGGEWYIKKV